MSVNGYCDMCAEMKQMLRHTDFRRGMSVELYIQFLESAHMKTSLPGYQNVDDPQKTEGPSSLCYCTIDNQVPQ